MSFFTILALAVALAMDAFAVAVTTGLRLGCLSPGQVLRMSAMFGGCQFAMPVIGWVLGVKAQVWIEAYDHWAAFGLLLFVGGKMVREAWENRGRTPEECACADPTSGGSLWLLGLATSLDALAVGLSMSLLGLEIWQPALIIGVVCAALTATGMYLGRFLCDLRRFASRGFKCNPGNAANALGGFVLIAIGAGILKEHGVFQGLFTL